MAKISDIIEGAKFKTPIDSAGKGRVGIAYAVSKRNIEEGTVNLKFEGEGCVVSGENWMPPSATMKIDCLKLETIS